MTASVPFQRSKPEDVAENQGHSSHSETHGGPTARPRRTAGLVQGRHLDLHRSRRSGSGGLFRVRGGQTQRRRGRDHEARNRRLRRTRLSEEGGVVGLRELDASITEEARADGDVKGRRMITREVLERAKDTTLPPRPSSVELGDSVEVANVIGDREDEDRLRRQRSPRRNEVERTTITRARAEKRTERVLQEFDVASGRGKDRAVHLLVVDQERAETAELRLRWDHGENAVAEDKAQLHGEGVGRVGVAVRKDGRVIPGNGIRDQHAVVQADEGRRGDRQGRRRGLHHSHELLDDVRKREYEYHNQPQRPGREQPNSGQRARGERPTEVDQGDKNRTKMVTKWG